MNRCRKFSLSKKLSARVYQKDHFFEIFSPVFYFMQKCPKTPGKKIQAKIDLASAVAVQNWSSMVSTQIGKAQWP